MNSRIFLVASVSLGQDNAIEAAKEISVAPDVLIDETNAFIGKIMRMVEERFNQNALLSTSISLRIEVGYPGCISNYEGHINAASTKSIWQQLWEFSLEIIPQVVHDIVCTTEFRSQRIMERQP